MAVTHQDSANAAQIAYWNDAGGRSWVERQEAQEPQLAPISETLLARAAVKPGARVIDVGCGMGATTEALARQVGAAGHVLGIDVSEPMLMRARARIAAGAPIEFVQADATAYPFPPQSFDLAVSRFGVMFFAEPAKSFANLRRALKLDGRLAFVCWRRPDENPWLTLPMRAALEHAPPMPQPGPEDPGPSSFASEGRVRRILGDAGFQAIALEPKDFEFDLGRGQGLDAAATTALRVGPASRALQGQPPAVVEAARDAIRRVLAPYVAGARVALPGAIWIVTAANG
jgi:SAM-dependent methyltransferase